VLAVVVAVIYLIQAKVSQANMAPEQRKQFAIMGYLSPLMMAFFSLTAPAAMPLYWTVGGSFLVLQTLLFRKMYPVEHPREPVIVEVSQKKNNKKSGSSKSTRKPAKS